MSTSTWASDNVPLDKPSPARLYDYWLGGYHNFEVDRIAAEKVAEAYPDVRLAAQVNRAFLRRAVHYLSQEGIDQFLDIGSGIPTAGHVHEIAQAANPAARTVYVDKDPIAVTHSQSILKGNPNAAAIQADLRQPRQILDHEEVQRLLDFGKPAAVVLVAVLHFVTADAEAYSAIRLLRDSVPPGSYIAVVHFTYENAPLELVEQLEKLYPPSANYGKARSPAEILQFFEGFEVVEPGLIHTPLWRPEGPDDIFLAQPERSLCLAGVGRKP